MKNVTVTLTEEEAKNLSTVLNTLNGRLQYRGIKCHEKDLEKISGTFLYWNAIADKLATSIGVLWMVDNEKTDLLINTK